MLGLGAILGKTAVAKGAGTTLGVKGHAIGMGMNVAGEKAAGRGWGEAVAHGAFWHAAGTMIKGAGLVPVAAMGVKAGVGSYLDHKRHGQSKLQPYYQGGFGGGYQDTEQAATMRQRGVQALQESKMNARSVLGSEARTFHQTMY